MRELLSFELPAKKVYKSTPQEVKRRLVYKVLVQNRPIKQASRQLRLNYSTAKTIVRQRRSHLADSASTAYSSHDAKNHIAISRQIAPTEMSKIQVVCTIGEKSHQDLRAHYKNLTPSHSVQRVEIISELKSSKRGKWRSLLH